VKLVRIKEPTRKQTDRHFRPYAVELGKLVYAWNDMQEKLVGLFCAVTKIPTSAIPKAIWHSTPSDLAQRNMLRAATEVNPAINDAEREDILWLLNKINRSLSVKRNDAIHAPLIFWTNALGISVEPSDYSLSPRAQSLKGKDILKEFTWYRQTAEALADYADAMRHALQFPGTWSWPEKPRLPHIGQKTIQRVKPRRKIHKGRRPPPRSSPA
jgi:hypothetical protein